MVDLGEIDEELGFPSGIPGAHATLQDSCATCHMEATPPVEKIVRRYRRWARATHFFCAHQL